MGSGHPNTHSISKFAVGGERLLFEKLPDDFGIQWRLPTQVERKDSKQSICIYIAAQGQSLEADQWD